MKNYIAFLFLFCLAFPLEFVHAQSTDETEDLIYMHLEKAKDLKGILDFNEALNYCNKAINLANTIDHKEYIANSHQLIGDIYLQGKMYNKALSELQRARRIQQSNDYTEDLAKTYNLLGLAHTELMHFYQAENYFEQASLLYKQLQLNSSNTTILKNKGKLYLKQEAFQKANKTFNIAYKLANRFELEGAKAEILLYNSQALNGLKQPKKAIEECQKAIKIGETNNYSWVVTEGYRTISDIYESNQDYENAYQNLHLHNRLRDSIFDINKVRLNAEETAKLNFADQDRLLEQKEKINQQIEEQLEQSKTVTLLGISLLILFLILLSFLYYSNQKRRKANELLQIAKEDAEKATKAKANFLSTITHELRTPLYTVTGLTDLLLEENPTPSQEEHLKSLRFSGDYLLNFINDILDVNKIEANKIEVDFKPFDLKSHAKKVLFALNKSAKDNNTILKFNCDKNIPSVITGDSLLLSQILINLISNAIKFTNNGNVTLNIKNLHTNTKSTKLLFEVIDTGIGISYDLQESVFESFSQGSVKINRQYGGTGLGLTIVKNILELLGSRIQLKSIPNEGTTFYFELEFDISHEKLNEEDHNDLTEKELKSLTGKNILLVEDVKINQLITQKTLMKRNINCTTADNGEEAVEKAQKEDFDLILMDLHMPGISGIEATKQIRVFNKTIPIIALTALTIENEELIAFNEAGFDDTLSKPFKSQNFYRKIHTLIHHS